MSKGRLMSFALTTQQSYDQIKDVTRRNGWKFLKAGDVLQAVEKAQGLGKGGHPVHIYRIRVVSTRWERLDEITEDDVRREGFPGKSPEWFINFYCEHNGGDGSQMVNRIEFAYEQEGKTMDMNELKRIEGTEVPKRPTTITAAQWDTIAEDVKAGRCKVHWSARIVSWAHKPAFTPEYAETYNVDANSWCLSFYAPYSSSPVTKLVLPDTELTLEWITEAAPKVESVDLHNDPEYLQLEIELLKIELTGKQRDYEAFRDMFFAKEREAKRLQAELDAKQAAMNFSTDLALQVGEAIDQWTEIDPETAKDGTKALAEMRRLYDVANERAAQAEGRVAKLRESAKYYLTEIQAIGRTSLDSGHWGTHEEWLEYMKSQCAHTATMGLKALDEGEAKS